MFVSNGKMQGFQRLSEGSVGFALVQLNSVAFALFSGKFSRSNQADFNKPQLFAPDFFRTSSAPWFSFSEVSVHKISELEVWAKEQLGTATIAWEEPEFSDLAGQAGQIELAFKNHELHKAVPTVFARALRTERDPSFLKLIAKAVANRGAGCFYALVLEDEGVVGVTPELLFEFDSNLNQINSMALAGTRASEMIPLSPLLTDSKELHEHNLVLVEIKNQLANFGKMECSDTWEWNLGALTHLRTDIRVQPEGVGPALGLFDHLEEALHPTPALGVSSEVLDYTWLKDLPGARPRFRFGAPFGVWLPDMGARVLVAIRNIQWTASQWILGSGCGYVPQSKMDLEWKELELKRASVRALFEV